MRQLALILSLLATGACGSSSGTVVGSVGWKLDFKDWTCSASDQASKASCQDQYRGCDNAGPAGTMVPYDPITTVRMVITDPAGQVQGFQQDYKCSLGSGGKRVAIRNVVRQLYSMTLEAKTADGTVFYRYEQPKFDLSSPINETVEMLASVGELTVYADFPSTNAGACPSGVDHLTYRLYAVDSSGQPAATPTLSGSAAACDGTIANPVVIRNIPVDPQPGANSNWINSRYELVLAARDTSNQVVDCSVDTRTVTPGNDSYNQDATMTAASSCSP